MLVSLEAEKDKETEFSLGSLEKSTALATPWFEPSETQPCFDLQPPELEDNKIALFKPLCLHSLTASVIEMEYNGV